MAPNRHRCPFYPWGPRDEVDKGKVSLFELAPPAGGRRGKAISGGGGGDSNPREACTPSGFQERTTHRSDLLRYRTGSTVHHHLTTRALQRANGDGQLRPARTIDDLGDLGEPCCPQTVATLLHAPGSAVGPSGASGG